MSPSGFLNIHQTPAVDQEWCTVLVCQPQDRAFQTSVRGSRIFSFSEEGLVIQISPRQGSGGLSFNLVVERLILDQSSTLRIGIARCLHYYGKLRIVCMDAARRTRLVSQSTM